MLRLVLVGLLGLAAGSSLQSTRRPDWVRLRGGTAEPSSFSALLKEMDADGNGTITIDEFIAYNRRRFEANLPSMSIAFGGQQLTTEKQWEKFEANTRRR